MCAWSIEEVTRFYGNYAHSYDDEIAADSYPAPSVIATWVLAHLTNSQPPEGGKFRVLDLGCGTGQSSKPFFEPPLNEQIIMYGIDATPEVLATEAGPWIADVWRGQMLEKAKQFPFQELRCQDIEAPLPYDEPFDAVVCVGVMDFIRSPQALLEKVAKSMRPNEGCCFGLTIPESGDLNKFNNDELTKLVHDSGFKILKHNRIFGYKDSETDDCVQYHGLLLMLR
ncbi:S-adenosyl-L-methionine-dependent methyltransferase [Fimicolochytrium jonesii]|uniref:S-adenosyl-L-methionine-dependent methyltransferase n=1 Tax=Fimicolochytrium jonesii TaxID=1396493 RepID=UPI0022FE11B1|nr:S-adenosyl-L-methionine-dependent methyltransferase [Fimicolochytrium jonesii]KAI8823703.1 S-adenosyl-L-methionine-dependent methyltransferase [Fimicolochytrium jonesii]